MATRFEIALHGPNPVALRAAAEEALDEIEGLDAKLSLFRPSSDISRVNALAASEYVRVEPRVFGLLQLAKRLHHETHGAFDITVAPLMRCWGFLGGSGRMPDEKAVEEARGRIGMEKVVLREEDATVRFEAPGMMIDLGGIGKGFGLESAAEILLEAGVTSALLHGGTSTICAIGSPPGMDSWDVAVESPQVGPDPISSSVAAPMAAAIPDDSTSLLTVISLRNESMSVSAVHGKSFSAGGTVYGHVIDPRIGRPVQGASLAAVILKSATETDALSTALLTLGLSESARVTEGRPEMRFLVVDGSESGGKPRMRGRGIELKEV